MHSEPSLSSTSPQTNEGASILRNSHYGDPLTNPGVLLSDFVARHLSKGKIWALCIILGGMVYLYSLSELTIARFWGSFEAPWDGYEHLLNIQYGTPVMRAFGVLFFSRLADIYSRPASSAAALSLFILGSILAAAAPNLPTYATGLIIHTIGSAGLGLLITLFIADYTLLKWRGLALSWIYFPYIINMWVSPRIHQNVSWRWVYGMFVILVTALCIPALVVLFSASAGHQAAPSRTSWAQKIKYGLLRVDLIGLALFTAGYGLIEYSTGLWWDIGRAARGVMLAVGLVLLLPAFVLWEVLYAPFPLMPKRILTNRAVTCGILAAFFCQLSHIISQRGVVRFVISSLLSDMKIYTYYLTASSMAYSVFAPIVGVTFLLTRRYKPQLLVGNGVFILGSGLLIHCARIAHPPESSPSGSLLLAAQILAGIGNVAIELGLAVGSQASVPHDDLSTVIALMSAWQMLGGSLGHPIAGAILSHAPISEHASFVILFTLALTLLLFPLVLSLLMPNYVLGATHNMVEEKDVTGQHISGANEARLNA